MILIVLRQFPNKSRSPSILIGRSPKVNSDKEVPRTIAGFYWVKYGIVISTEAFETADRLAELVPLHYYPFLIRHYLAFLEENDEAAEADFRRCVERIPEAPEHLEFIAEYFFITRRFEIAEKMLDRVIVEEPDNGPKRIDCRANGKSRTTISPKRNTMPRPKRSTLFSRRTQFVVRAFSEKSNNPRS